MKTIVYLSGAPRISTSAAAENTAARNHIIEVCASFEKSGYQVSKYILGDKLPTKMTGKGSENLANKSILHRIATDIFRLLLILKNRQNALKYYNKNIELVYERFALMQSVGWAFKKKGIPWVLETNAILSDEAFYESKTLYLKGIAEALEKQAYMKCDLLITISDSLKNSIISKYHIDDKKIFVMQNGVNTTVFQPQDTQKLNDETFTIGYVGSIVKWQSLELLLTAVSELKEELPKMKVLIVGDGPEKQALERFATNQNLEKHIEFTGRVKPDQVPNMINTFSIGYCNPHHESGSSSEVFNSPMKLYEYLAMGKPVIAQDNYDLTQLAYADRYLYKLHGYNLEELKKAIRYFYTQKEQLDSLGRIALEEIQKNHSWDSRIKRLLTHFKNI